MFNIQYKNWKRGGGKGDVHTVTLIVQEWNVKVQCDHLSLGCAKCHHEPIADVPGPHEDMRSPIPR